NVGSRERLDFTVIGPAVNEASRIAAMCRSVDQPVLMSSAFADVGGINRRLVSVGRYALRGVAHPQELFTLDSGGEVGLIAAALGENLRREKETGMYRMIAAAAMVTALSAHAAAQDWPTRPITLIVPFAAGGGIDVSARIQAQRMGELLGQSIVIENVGAAAGMAGGVRVAK